MDDTGHIDDGHDPESDFGCRHEKENRMVMSLSRTGNVR